MEYKKLSYEKIEITVSDPMCDVITTSGDGYGPEMPFSVPRNDNVNYPGL